MMGWNPGCHSTKEIYTMQELIEEFSLEKLNKTSSTVNMHRLDWYNKMHYTRKLNCNNQMYVEAMSKHLRECNNAIRINDVAYYNDVIDICKGRIATVEKFISICTPFFIDPIYQQAIISKESFEALEKLYDMFVNCREWSNENIKQILNHSTLNMPFKTIAIMLRTILMNVSIGPPLHDLIKVLGKDAVLRRINNYKRAMCISETSKQIKC